MAYMQNSSQQNQFCYFYDFFPKCVEGFIVKCEVYILSSGDVKKRKQLH